MSYKKEYIAEIAAKLKSYGYTVYVSKTGEYGSYTNGVRVVCFDSSGRFSGNYEPMPSCGTGWMITDAIYAITAIAAEEYIKANAPRWAVGDCIGSVKYTTPEKHLARYGSSSGYTVF